MKKTTGHIPRAWPPHAWRQKIQSLKVRRVRLQIWLADTGQDAAASPTPWWPEKRGSRAQEPFLLQGSQHLRVWSACSQPRGRSQAEQSLSLWTQRDQTCPQAHFTEDAIRRSGCEAHLADSQVVLRASSPRARCTPHPQGAETSSGSLQATPWWHCPESSLLTAGTPLLDRLVGGLPGPMGSRQTAGEASGPYWLPF